jgi:hypothetical protein
MYTRLVEAATSNGRQAQQAQQAKQMSCKIKKIYEIKKRIGISKLAIIRYAQGYAASDTLMHLRLGVAGPIRGIGLRGPIPTHPRIRGGGRGLALRRALNRAYYMERKGEENSTAHEKNVHYIKKVQGQVHVPSTRLGDLGIRFIQSLVVRPSKAASPVRALPVLMACCHRSAQGFVFCRSNGHTADPVAARR